MNNHSKYNYIIELLNVDTIYEGESIPAIRGVNLKVKKGEFLCIIGPNGAGKTTLLETINGLLEHTEGKVNVFGKEIKRFGSSIRKEVGYVPQGFSVSSLMPFLVKDVVLMGRFGKIGLFKSASNEDYQRVKKAIELVGIDGLLKKPIGKLSGGQLQKVMITRALAKDPKILLLDEPFSSLDFKALAEISERVSSLHEEKNLTTLMVIHNIPSIPNQCRRVVLINEGVVIQDGPVDEVLNSESLKFVYEVKR
ncbi:MAG: ABC transporter ATP-binding protein [Candidatus Aerophobetes bacterium]|nr:ABC transporter ATP-binding protein [Candidatus Aerophobetes bacterium]